MYLERQHITGGQVDEQVEVGECVHVVAACELMHVLAERREILSVSKTNVSSCSTPSASDEDSVNQRALCQVQLVLRVVCHQRPRQTQSVSYPQQDRK